MEKIYYKQSCIGNWTSKILPGYPNTLDELHKRYIKFLKAGKTTTFPDESYTAATFTTPSIMLDKFPASYI